MTDPTGRSAPGEINELLIWEEVHPLVFAEYEVRLHGRLAVVRLPYANILYSIVRSPPRRRLRNGRT